MQEEIKRFLKRIVKNYRKRLLFTLHATKQMRCYYCKGKMKKGKTTYSIDRKGYHFLMHDVAAWICEQCGEQLFEEKEVESIQNLIKILDSQTGKISRLKLHPVRV